MNKAIEALRSGSWQHAALIIGGLTCLAVNAVMIPVVWP